MNAPDGKLNSGFFQRFTPSEYVLVYAVDQCAVEIENESGALSAAVSASKLALVLPLAGASLKAKADILSVCALLVAATLTAAIRLRGEPIANTPRVISTIHDSIKLARMILRTLNTG